MSIPLAQGVQLSVNDKNVQVVSLQKQNPAKKVANLTLKIVFWTQKIAVGLIDMGNSEPQNHKPKIVNESLP